jgi:DNA ligase (NAD+)
MVLLIERGLYKKYGSFDSIGKILKIFPMLKKEEIKRIKGAGLKVAESLVDFFQNKVNLRMIADLKNNGVEIVSETEKKAILEKKIFVFTGRLNSITRDNAKEAIIGLGGKTSESVSERTNFLVAGENPGSKYNKAKKLGVKIINEKELLKLIKQK